MPLADRNGEWDRGTAERPAFRVAGREENVDFDSDVSWQKQLESWAKSALASGETEILSYALPEFERILLEAALNHTNGHKQDAAKVLGWGRNTLTRKLKELY